MGKGGLNRLLLTESDLKTPSLAILPAIDSRSIHIRTFLAAPTASTLTLRIALENSYSHDAAPTDLLPDGTIQISLPETERHPAPALPPVLLLLAMQRPKVTARILAAVSALGVQAVLFVDAKKVEKTYWDCKLFRTEQLIQKPELVPPFGAMKACQTFDDDPSQLNDRVRSFPGEADEDNRNLGPGKVTLDKTKPKKLPKTPISVPVHNLPSVRRRLLEGIEQAAHDTFLPQIALHRYPLETALSSTDEHFGPAAPWRRDWTRMVAHPPRGDSGMSGSITFNVKNAEGAGVVIAIGPEGGWTDEEVSLLEKNGFHRISLGERVLRSETAVIVALGLAHEGLRAKHNTKPVRNSG